MCLFVLIRSINESVGTFAPGYASAIGITALPTVLRAAPAAGLLAPITAPAAAPVDPRDTPSSILVLMMFQVIRC